MIVGMTRRRGLYSSLCVGQTKPRLMFTCRVRHSLKPQIELNNMAFIQM